ncbi:MAG TPA: NrsF family protein [Bryobacteraceae bacterium]|nr:NrsF family protein [Bryobacteraceae bacterium]
MNCSDLDFLLSTAGSDGPLPTGLSAHLKTCARCQALAAALNQSQPLTSLPGESIASVEDRLLKNLKPVHALPSKKLFFAAFLSIFFVLLALGIFHLGAFAWAELSLTRRIMICASLGASAALLAYSMVQQMFPGSRRRLSPALLSAGTFVCLTLILAALFEVGHSGRFLRDGIPCFEAGIPYAVPAAILFWLILRRGVMLSPRATGVICGALAGLIGVSVLEVHCSNFDLRHILVWHLGVGVVGALAGLAIGWVGEMISRRRIDS